MKNIKELITKINEKEFNDTVDLHIHSTCSDGEIKPEILCSQALRKGLRLFSITDHNTLNAYSNPIVKNSENIIPGIEFDCWHKGVLIHILGYGIDVSNKKLLSFCSKDKKGTELDIIRFFTYRNPKKVIEAIHNAGGIAVLAHPACCWCFGLKSFIKSLKKMGLDGIEVFYIYRRHRSILKFHSKKRVLKIAKQLDLIITGGSDEHNEIK